MAICPVLRFGDLRLIQPAAPVQKFNTPELDRLITDLTDTMEQHDGVGIAAPQIGVPTQVTIFGCNNNPRYPHAEPVPFTVLINPSFDILSPHMVLDDCWEGCLSLPGLRGRIPRYNHIRYHGFDAAGNAISKEVKNFHARVVQHEIDHVHGILNIMRAHDLRNFGFEHELEQRPTC